MDLTGAIWRKSSYSTQNGSCVEAARCAEAVAVRDSTDPHGPHLAFTTGDWQAFLRQVKRGQLSLP